MNTHLIEKKFDLLPEHLKKEALDFIDLLITKGKQKKINRHFDFTWEGGLADLKDSHSSVELQHKSMDWRCSIYLTLIYFWKYCYLKIRKKTVKKY